MTMEAMYDGHCEACDGGIEAGDEITREDGDWIHADCAGSPLVADASPAPADALDVVMGDPRKPAADPSAGYGTLVGLPDSGMVGQGNPVIAGLIEDARKAVIGTPGKAPAVAPQAEYKSPDRYDRYVLAHPGRDGKVVTLSRCTTVVKAGDDMYALGEWQKGNVALGLSRRTDLLALAGTMKPGDKSLKRLVKDAEEAGGGSAKANLGTALHGYTEMVDWGRPLTDVPEPHRADIGAYLDALVANRLTVVPAAIERITMTSEWDGIAGKFDRVYRLVDGTYVIGDVKSGKVGYDPKVMFAQMAVYAQGVNEVGVYDVARECWEHLPFEVRTDVALIVHLPAGEGKCTVYVADLEVGRAHVAFCASVRRQRKLKHPLPVYAPAVAAAGWWYEAIRATATRAALARVGRAMDRAGAMTPELRELAMAHREDLPD